MKKKYLENSLQKGKKQYQFHFLGSNERKLSNFSTLVFLFSRDQCVQISFISLQFALRTIDIGFTQNSMEQVYVNFIIFHNQSFELLHEKYFSKSCSIYLLFTWSFHQNVLQIDHVQQSYLLCIIPHTLHIQSIDCILYDAQQITLVVIVFSSQQQLGW